MLRLRTRERGEGAESQGVGAGSAEDHARGEEAGDGRQQRPADPRAQLRHEGQEGHAGEGAEHDVQGAHLRAPSRGSGVKRSSRDRSRGHRR